MANDPKVVVYGVGYTAKLCAEYLVTRGIPFYFVGRNPAKIEASIKLIEERVGHSIEVEGVVAENVKEALIPTFEKADVVINTVGPFWQLGGPVVDACLEAGCHYLDTTGEQDWVLHCKEKYGQAYADKGLLLAPANSFMWVAGALVAEVALETEGVDTLDIVYDIVNALPSVGSSKSFLRMVTGDQYYLEQRELVKWENNEAYSVSLPHKSRPMLTLPWSGGCEPVWFQDDDRVLNCKVLTGFGDEMMLKVVGLIDEIHDEAKNSSTDKEDITNRVGDEISDGEPDKDTMDVQRSYIVCFAQGRQVTEQFVLSIAAPYQWTGQVSAECAERILNGQLKAVGFQSPAKAFGHHELINKFHELGYTNKFQ